jgi:hypothetical protein
MTRQDRATASPFVPLSSEQLTVKAGQVHEEAHAREKRTGSLGTGIRLHGIVVGLWSAGVASRGRQDYSRIENVGASSIVLTADEHKEVNASLSEIHVRGQRLPDAVLAFSGVEAPPKT